MQKKRIVSKGFKFLVEIMTPALIEVSSYKRVRGSKVEKVQGYLRRTGTAVRVIARINAR